MSNHIATTSVDYNNINSVVTDLHKEIEELSSYTNQQKQLLFDKEHEVAELRDKYKTLEIMHKSDLSNESELLIRKQNELDIMKNQLDIINDEYCKEQYRANLMQSEGLKRVFLLHQKQQDILIYEKKYTIINEKYENLCIEHLINVEHLDDTKEKLKSIDKEYQLLLYDNGMKALAIKKLEDELNMKTAEQALMLKLLQEEQEELTNKVHILGSEGSKKLLVINQLQEENTILKKQIEQLSKELQSQELVEETLQVKVSTMGSEILQYEDEINKLSIEINTKDSKYNNDIKTHQTEILELQMKFSDLEIDVKNKDQQYEEHKTILNELAKKTKVIEVLEQQLTMKQQDIIEKSIQSEAYQNETISLNQQYEMILNQWKESKDHIEQLELELQRINIHCNEKELLYHNKVLEVTTLIQENEINHQSYQNQIKQYEDEINKLSTEINIKDSKYNNDIKSHQTEILQLQMKLITEEKTTSSLESTILLNNNKISSVELSLEDMKNILNELKKELEHERNISFSKSQQIQSLEDMVKSLSDQLEVNKMKNEENILLKDFELKNCKLEFINKIQNKSKQIHQYQQDLKKAKHDMNLLKQELDTFTNTKFYKRTNHPIQQIASVQVPHHSHSLIGVGTMMSNISPTPPPRPMNNKSQLSITSSSSFSPTSSSLSYDGYASIKKNNHHSHHMNENSVSTDAAAVAIKKAQLITNKNISKDSKIIKKYFVS